MRFILILVDRTANPLFYWCNYPQLLLPQRIMQQLTKPSTLQCNSNKTVSVLQGMKSPPIHNEAPHTICTQAVDANQASASSSGKEDRGGEQEFGFFGLVGTAAVSAAGIAGILLVLALGEGAMVMQQSSSTPQELPSSSATKPPPTPSATPSSSDLRSSAPVPAPFLRGVS